MRTPEAQIKQAILHPEEEMREQALHYFSDARSQDDTVMPLVIQAVESTAGTPRLPSCGTPKTLSKPMLPSSG